MYIVTITYIDKSIKTIRDVDDYYFNKDDNMQVFISGKARFHVNNTLIFAIYIEEVENV